MAIFNPLEAAIIPTDSLGNVSVLDMVNNLKEVGRDDIDTFISLLVTEFLHFAANVLVAIVVYYIGRIILRFILKATNAAFEKRDVEPSVRSFARSMIKAVFYVVLLLTIVQILGINTTSLVAMVASAGLAIGMALSGTLQNFAGGVMVLFLKPYKVGDYIIAQGQAGTVQEIMLFTTVLETFNGDTIFVPNSSISSSIIENYTHSGERRIVWTVSVSYGDDCEVVKGAIMDILNADERIINDPSRPELAPSVVLSKLADSSVNFDARVWVTNEHYWSVMFDVNEQIYKQLPQKGARFPFPQLDVNIKNKS